MSSLGFASGAYLRASGTRDAFGRASDQLVREGYPAIVVNSGDREYAEQVAIFLLRYVQVGDVRGRRVYDIRYWNGVAWYRVSADGTVAVPGTSNHESRRAADLAWPYNNRNTAAHRRLQQIAAQYGLKWTGVNFSEDWHWEFLGGLGFIGQAAAAVGSAGGFLMALSEHNQNEMYEWLRGMAFGEYPKAGDQPIKWWLQALGGEIGRINTRLTAKNGEGVELGFDWLPHIVNQLNALGGNVQDLRAGIATVIQSAIETSLKAADLDLDEAELQRIVGNAVTGALNGVTFKATAA